jgi:Na+/proline symporter
MIMHFWDWVIVAGLLGLMTFAALSTRKYNKGVVDFLSAGRCARKYVLGVAEGLSCVGAITIVAWFEAFYRGGFSVAWWTMVTLLAQVLVAMSGWIAYRYRQTRAMTLAQILEMRYSKNFRVFAGFVIFVSGTLNFGLFPAIAGRFFQYYFGWEPFIYAMGGMEIDLIYAGIMALLTIIALFFVFAGGQITIMLTDFIQGTFANICLSIIVVFILFTVPWAKIVDTIGQRDAVDISPIAAVESGADFSKIIERGMPGVDPAEKYMFSDVTLKDLAEGELKMDKVIATVTPSTPLLSGTDYSATFSYKAAGDNQYTLAIISKDGRQESQTFILPSTDGEAKETTLGFKSTNIGMSELFFIQGGTAATDFALTTPVKIDLKKGQSMLNPFNSAGTKDFNWSFFLIQALVIFWTYKAWQGTQGYYSAAINAHEARMGGVVGNMRIMVQNMMLLLVPIAAYAILFDKSDNTISVAVTEQMAALPSVTMQNQLRTTMVLTRLLPVGLIGAFAAVMMAAFIGTNGTYMHSWGSIFVQDIYMPMRRKKKALSPTEHFKTLKWAIAGVGIFAFFYSLFFEQSESILMYFALTGTIWLGGAGAVIALGLYWSRGTTAGAYTSIVTGMVVAIVGFVCQRNWVDWTGGDFPLNSQYMMLVALVISTILYIIVSLITCREPHNMDKLLHRGEYAGEDSTEKAKHSGDKKQKRTLLQMIGIDADFSFLDKILYIFVTSWSFIMSAIFIVGIILNKSGVLTLDNWTNFWHGYVIVAVSLGIITTVWFSIGGFVDLADLLKRLKHRSLDETDDGSVEGED